MVLELGGSDPFVVMPSADLDRAAKVATTPRCQNNGQSCIAAKRFIVHTDVYDEFVELFTAEMAALRRRRPDGGRHRRRPAGHRAGSRGRRGAGRRTPSTRARPCMCGGERPDRAGWCYPPTVDRRHHRGHGMYPEEVFGPVAMVYRVGDIDEAIAVANATRFGLGSNAWTTDPDEQERFIRDLRRRSDLRQRHDRLVPVAAVRWDQGVRLRPRARGARHARVHQHQDRLGRPLAGAPVGER